ncbi:efflux RND transporter periplasmic adaptor subunit [Parendozoicomonas haliclonae]|uniref:Multidrug resistance protein MdtA n=1 Tax=Parendozoicomonas haliclonae TaxID=1960125 RepID=A0A1X7AME0_9GAMM|nr:efflux RND transporter periplasmic adaptor subunit [Parendozoicomonas haliclonae]SMA49103.1 Multidrug resistance protein MdtA precursor [Parendozoicomonas haliclonae]
MLKKMLLMLTVTGVLFGAVFGVYFMMMQGMSQGMASYVPPPTAVKAADATQESWHPYLSSIGTLTARQGVDIRSEVSGIIKELNFRSGQDITEGQLLITLDDDVERANLKSFQARKKLAQLTWERDKSLLAQKAISRTQFDQSTATLDEAAAAVEQTLAVLDNKKITAPFSGRIGISRAEAGDYIRDGDKLATLQNIDELYLDFNMPEQDYPKLFIGQTVNFTVQAYPDQVFTAKVDAINAKVDSSTRNIEVRALMDNRDRLLVPGMFADLQVLAEKPVDVITLPETAITYTLYGDSVYVIRGDAEQLSVELVQIETGDIQGNRVAILSGLEGNEQVVDGGQLKLYNGASVAIKGAGDDSGQSGWE